MPDTALSIGQCATLACLLEVTASKPGNVHRGADFADLTFADFAISAVAIAPPMEKAPEVGVGQTVLDAVTATRRLISTNTNLGTILLLAPLAAVPRSQRLTEGIKQVLDGLTPADSRMVYEAIRMAQPGGLGKVEAMDVADQPPVDLLAAMQAAASRDLVARQYSNNFAEVLHLVVPWLAEGRASGWSLTDTIIHTHLRLMSEYPDSLIARKCSERLARESAARAAAVLAAGKPGAEVYFRGLSDLDFWLRSDGHRRNPGTTADLIAAGLFAALRDGTLGPTS